MDVVASGVMWDARTAPVNERTASATSILLTSDGTLLATCRLGSDREGGDGHTAILASTDAGDSWELRYLSLGERVWDGVPGETRGWYLAELQPGELTASVLWTDRSDPDEPWVHPVTQGLLDMHVYQLVSTDGGRSWPVRRRISLDPHPGRVVDGAGAPPVGWGARAAVRALEGAPRPGTGAPGRLAASVDRRRGDVADGCPGRAPSRRGPLLLGPAPRDPPGRRASGQHVLDS